MDPAQVRAGDRDRTATSEVLQQAAEDGRLTPEELRQRVDLLAAARTFADLDALVVDLPVAPPSARLLAPAASGAPGSSPTDALRLSGGMSNDKRSGVWEIPPYIEISGGMGSVRMDCLQAHCAHDIVHIQISGGMGSILIVLPPGWAANVDRLEKSWGSLTTKVPAQAAPGCPTLVLRGSAGAGSVRIRGAGWWDRRRLRKQGIELGRQPRPALPPGPSGPPSAVEQDQPWTEHNPDVPNSDTLR